MRALLLHLFEPLLCLIERLTLHLGKGGDIIPEFGGLPGREILEFKNALERPSQVVNELAFEFIS